MNIKIMLRVCCLYFLLAGFLTAYNPSWTSLGVNMWEHFLCIKMFLVCSKMRSAGFIRLLKKLNYKHEAIGWKHLWRFFAPLINETATRGRTAGEHFVLSILLWTFFRDCLLGGLKACIHIRGCSKFSILKCFSVTSKNFSSHCMTNPAWIMLLMTVWEHDLVDTQF